MPVPSRLLALLLSAIVTQVYAEEEVVLYADKIIGEDPAHWTAEGNVEVQYQNRTLYADRVDYDRNQNEVVARGNVKLVAPGIVTEAPEARIWIDQDRGIILSPRYQLPERQGQGQAEKAEQVGPNRYVLTQGDYSSCPSPRPAWRIKARSIKVDQNKEKITVRGGHLDLFSVPVMYLPYLSFPTADRASGFLAPSFGNSQINGFTLSAPYYWNIAPNRDATITPRYLSERGLQLQNEFRYLGQTSRGEAHLEVLPGDRLTGSTVYAGDLRQYKRYSPNISSELDLRYVSYRHYLSDFGAGLGYGNLPYLNSRAQLNYTGDHLQAGVALKGYQELAQVSDSPYQQLPNAYVNGRWPLGGGFYSRILGDFNYFTRERGVLGQRLHLVPRLGWRLERSYGYLEPEVGTYLTRYQLQRTEPEQTENPTRILPSLGLSGGLFFERRLGSGMTQTLEPHFRYLYILTEDQSDIPLFDTGVRQLTYPVLFEDNLFAGSDRINGANRVTLGLSSSLLSAGNGRELFRASVGQIRSFDDRQVDLSGRVVEGRRQSDYFALLRWQPRQDMRLFTDAQLNPDDRRLERFNLGAQYQPGIGRVFNLSYRYTRDFIDQVAVSGQWPLGGRWQATGSYRYNLRESSPLEHLVGLGYDGGCWATRLMVYEQLRLGGERNNAVYFQILLRGLTSLGNQPAATLRQLIPGAQMEY